jgi:hypothetical protein
MLRFFASEDPFDRRDRQQVEYEDHSEILIGPDFLYLSSNLNLGRPALGRSKRFGKGSNVLPGLYALPSERLFMGYVEPVSRPVPEFSQRASNRSLVVDQVSKLPRRGSA